jgi:hypothetical protein
LLSGFPVGWVGVRSGSDNEALWVLAGLRLSDLIASRFDLAATVGWQRGSGRSSVARSGWARAQSGSDNEVTAGLRSSSGCLARSGPSSTWQRWEVVGGGLFSALGMLRGPIPLGDQAALLSSAALPPAVARWGSLRPAPESLVLGPGPVSRTLLGTWPSLPAWR